MPKVRARYSAAINAHAVAAIAWPSHTSAMPEWDPDLEIEPPSWMVEGARVLHSTFGSGTIGRVGTYKDVPSVGIDFDNGQTKALALEFGLEHLTPEPAAKERKSRRLFGR